MIDGRRPPLVYCVLMSVALLPGLVPGASGVALAEDNAPFLAGFAERDVSPEIGSEQPAGYGKAYHQSFHDACKVRAAVFDDGHEAVAIVGLDALLIRGECVQRVRDAIEKQCGIPGNHVMVAASHSHSAGATGMILPGEYDDAPESVRRLAYDYTVIADAKYLARLEAAIVDAVVSAHATRAESRCAAGFGFEDKAAFNRRFRMRNGRTMTHPGQGNPEIIEPAGPIDPQVGIIGAWTADGQLRGCLVNYACHATTGPGGISADYIYYIEKTIRGLMGDDVVVVFVAGMAGDVTQVDNQSPYQIKQFGEVSARNVGGRVGAEALRTLLAIEQSAGSLAPLAAKQTVLSIPRRVPSPERVAKAKELTSKKPEEVDHTEWAFAKEIVLLDARLKKEPVAPVELQAIQVGPAVLLSCPAEYFCEFGLQIKQGSPFPLTFPVSLANDCIGYVPTEEALSPTGGGYETRLTSYSNLVPSAGPQIAQGLIDLAQSLKPGAIPEAPALPPFTGKPWTYGSVPPELE